MAPSRLAPVLALQVEAWTPTDSGETSPVDSAHGRRKPVVGRGAYCKRVVGEIGHLRFAANGKEAHAQATAPVVRVAISAGQLFKRSRQAIVACDWFVAVTATFRLLYVLVLIHHRSRRLLHFNV